jgi:hypothetical protein
MRSSVLSALALTIACDLSFLVATSLAQQPSRSASPSPTRRGYFTRVQTQADAASRLDLSQSRNPRSQVALNGESSRGNPDPLRPYADNPRSGVAPRPYERTPVISPPEREIPAPAVSHNYYPSLRSGQGPNRNVVTRPLCVPGRSAFFHR